MVRQDVISTLVYHHVVLFRRKPLGHCPVDHSHQCGRQAHDCDYDSDGVQLVCCISVSLSRFTRRLSERTDVDNEVDSRYAGLKC